MYNRRKVDQKYYEANKLVMAERSDKNRQKIRQWFLDKKAQLKCQRCGASHPAIIQFHHRDPKSKTKNVSDMALRGYGIKRIEEEIAKCDILCANCHFIVEWELRGNAGDKVIARAS